jgi:hypothetical protein
MIESRKDDFEVDAGLFELRVKYNDMKKERIKSEKDALLLRNKIKMLTNEEVKVSKKEQKEKKDQEEIERIRLEILTEKDILDKLKKDKEDDVLLKKCQIIEMRENIRNALTTWRRNLQEKNKGELMKFKLLKAENEIIIEMNKKEAEKKNKDICETVKIQKMTMSEKKKKEEVRINEI